jgi:hypothetical protein
MKTANTATIECKICRKQQNKTKQKKKKKPKPF